MKTLPLKALRLPGATRVFRPLMRRRAAVFMLHRIRNPDLGISGHDASVVRRILAELRRRKTPMVPLSAVVDAIVAGEPIPSGAVAFTVDDGYLDQGTILADVFAEFDCPVTTFVTSGFLDGNLWFWWDQIEYVFRNTTRPSMEVELDGQAESCALESVDDRSRAQARFTAWCKLVPDGDKLRAIGRLAHEAEVDLPVPAPEAYRPMSWDQLRACEGRGMTFGPHTVTHPVLSRTDDEQSTWEISNSWTRLQAEATRPVPVFCYPNGNRADYGEREIRAIRDAGLSAAVTGDAGYIDEASSATRDGRFRLRRFALPGTVEHALQYASGLERAKQIIRREA